MLNNIFSLHTKCKTIISSIPICYAKCHSVNTLFTLKNRFVLINSIMPTTSGCDTLRPLGIQFWSFVNNMPRNLWLGIWAYIPIFPAITYCDFMFVNMLHQTIEDIEGKGGFASSQVRCWFKRSAWLQIEITNTPPNQWVLQNFSQGKTTNVLHLEFSKTLITLSWHLHAHIFNLKRIGVNLENLKWTTTSIWCSRMGIIQSGPRHLHRVDGS